MDAFRINAVADAIEGKTIPHLGFNMRRFEVPVHSGFKDKLGVPDCETVACIAGWTWAMFGDTVHGSFNEAGELLGLDETQRKDLFFAYSHPDFRNHAMIDFYDRIMPDQAVRTLRHLAATEVVDWTV